MRNKKIRVKVAILIIYQIHVIFRGIGDFFILDFEGIKNEETKIQVGQVMSTHD
jgi:hypothetical protein